MCRMTPSDMAQQKIQDQTRENSQFLAIQLILRSILLKINTEKANEAMEGQLLEQVDAVTQIMQDAEMKYLSEQEPGLSQDESLALKSMVVSEMDVMRNKTKQIIKGIFQKPEDLLKAL